MGPLGNNKEMTLNKLILLHIINKAHIADIAPGNLQITRFVLENRLMNYFSMQHCLEELRLDGYLLIEGEGGYFITEAGKDTLGCLDEMIPAGLRKSIDMKLWVELRRMSNEMSIDADFDQTDVNEFIVTCNLKEGDFPVMQLKVAAGTKKDAQNICTNWKKHCQEIFPEILDVITKNREE